MTGSIEIPFAIGEWLWWHGYGGREVIETCPECAGKRVLVVIQGDGQQFEIDCRCCGDGYDRSTGVVKRTRYRHEPELFIAARVDIHGNEITYSNSSPDASCYRSVRAEDLFRDRDACAARCAELDAERACQEEKAFIANRLHRRRDMAWSVHYWQSQERDLARQWERVRARLRECKERKVVKP